MGNEGIGDGLRWIIVGRSRLLAVSDEPQAGQNRTFREFFDSPFRLCDSYGGATGTAEMIRVSGIRCGDLLNGCSA